MIFLSLRLPAGICNTRRPGRGFERIQRGRADDAGLCRGDQGGGKRRARLPKKMNTHGGEQNRRRGLAVPARAQRTAKPPHHENAPRRHIRFLRQQQRRERTKARAAACQQPERHDLRQLVGHGIEHLAEVGNHVVLPGKIAVRAVGRHRQKKRARRAGHIARAVQSRDQPRQQQSERGQQIGYGENCAFPHALAPFYASMPGRRPDYARERMRISANGYCTAST